MLDRLEGADGPAEPDPVLRLPDRHVQGARGRPRLLRGRRRTAQVAHPGQDGGPVGRDQPGRGPVPSGRAAQAADQRELCRALAVTGGDKFAGIPWRPAGNGAFLLDGVLASV
ncbi:MULTISPECIES: flavin reductase family protein [unclassified Streptomyces]|uniref:flavin reductase family protein n=1 Tax=unclassified Streptomyces TaxID=2593676 RepID=UPI001F1DC153|nr:MULTISPECIES: flavin reductase family protein [unclassified Streptomyces]